MKSEEFLDKLYRKLESIGMQPGTQFAAVGAARAVLGEAKEIFTDVELKQIGSVEIKADNLFNGNDRLTKAFDEWFKQATGGRKWTGTAGAVPMYQCGVPGKVIGFFLPVECDGVKPPMRVKYTIEEVPLVVKPAPSPPAPTKCEPWPPAQHLLDGFKYEVGDKLFTLFKVHNDNRVQLRMSQPNGFGLSIGTVATFGEKLDARVDCNFGHISAVAAAIPRAEVFIRNLYDPKNPSIPGVVAPAGCRWESADVFELRILRNSNNAWLSSVPENHEERDAMLACVEAFDAMKCEYQARVLVPADGLDHWAKTPKGPGRYAVSFRKLPNG